MVQIFITGDDTGTVTAQEGIPATGDLFAFEWDFIANGFASPGPADLDDPILASWSISTPATYGTATLSSTVGFSVEWTYTLDDSNPAVQALALGETLADSFVVRAVSFDDGSIFAGFKTVDITIFGVCFAAGTKIETDTGPVPVQDLVEGQKVRTLDDGFQPVKWIGGQWHSREELSRDKTLLPVRIAGGALGENTPSRDLLVSQQHRLLLSGALIELNFGEIEVLVAAKHLCTLPGITVVDPQEPLGYFHVLCDRHHVVTANGAYAETMFLGDETLLSLPSADLDRLVGFLAAQPVDGVQTVLSQPACRRVLTSHEARAISAELAGCLTAG